MSDQNPAGPQGASCNGDGGCPLCRGLWPSSGRGKIIVIVVALAALGIVVGWELLRPTRSNLTARYEGLVSVGKTDEAAKVLGEVIDAGIALYGERKFDEAAKVFEWVVSKDPKRAVALGYLGVMARDRKDDAKAIEWFTRAAEVDPLSPLHFYNLALIHLTRKDYAACEAQIEKAMKLSPKAEYQWLYAVCAQEGLQPVEVVRKRLRDTISSAVVQANWMNPADLTPNGSLANAWTRAAKRLAELGDRSGWDRLKKLAADSPTKEVREFAQALLAGAGKP